MSPSAWPHRPMIESASLATPTHAASGRTAVALTVAAAALLPVRLLLYHASQSPPSRPMAAMTFPRQSREDHPTTRAGDERLPSHVVPGRVA